MGTISLQRVTTGTEITVNEFNNNCATLEDTINGDLDNGNIAADADIEVSKLLGGTEGQALVTTSSTPVWAHRPRVLLASGTSVSVTNTTVETDIFSHVIPGGTLGANGVVLLEAVGEYRNNTGSNRTFDFAVKIDGNSHILFQDTSISLPDSANNRAWHLRLLLGNRNATNSQYLNGLMLVSGATTATNGIGDLAAADFALRGLFAGTATAETAGAITFSATVQHSAALAALSFALHYVELTLLRT